MVPGNSDNATGDSDNATYVDGVTMETLRIRQIESRAGLIMSFFDDLGDLDAAIASAKKIYESMGARWEIL